MNSYVKPLYSEFYYMQPKLSLIQEPKYNSISRIGHMIKTNARDQAVEIKRKVWIEHETELTKPQTTALEFFISFEEWD